MKLYELLAELKEFADAHGDDIDVRLAVQPNWPLRHSISNVSVLTNDQCEGCEQCNPDDIGAIDEDEEAYYEEGCPTDKKQVWIAATDSHPYDENPYAPREAWNN